MSRTKPPKTLPSPKPRAKRKTAKKTKPRRDGDHRSMRAMWLLYSAGPVARHAIEEEVAALKQAFRAGAFAALHLVKLGRDTDTIHRETTSLGDGL